MARANGYCHSETIAVILEVTFLVLEFFTYSEIGFWAIRRFSSLTVT